MFISRYSWQSYAIRISVVWSWSWYPQKPVRSIPEAILHGSIQTHPPRWYVHGARRHAGGGVQGGGDRPLALLYSSAWYRYSLWGRAYQAWSKCYMSCGPLIQDLTFYSTADRVPSQLYQQSFQNALLSYIISHTVHPSLLRYILCRYIHIYHSSRHMTFFPLHCPYHAKL